MSETRNRVWTVRAGSDGIGLDLFHVYAPDMNTARDNARENAKAAGFTFGDDFTVHGLRDGEPLPWATRLGNNVVTDHEGPVPVRPRRRDHRLGRVLPRATPRQVITTKPPTGSPAGASSCSRSFPFARSWSGRRAT
jgi:hypothetical protein